ncbi:hypothetical protein NA57DRAFT_47165 [Rhizodiscina lignyota]|uniref:BZIP domain-containing protein n=1 Tax=Rhizodiscina lignyota TaxID=1504668 RepID=A0A9P4I5I0_9PEZI|nr:hypothetical protein NA57DRAFT_47165 [Rhizodiscina lignyota]
MDTQHMDYWMQLQNQHHYQHGENFEYSPEMSATPSLSGSPILSEFDSVAPAHLYQPSYSHIAQEDIKFPYQLPMTPSDFGSADESAYCSPQPPLAELSYPPIPSPITATSVPVSRSSGQEQRTHATSGRRRAQNRAAQRAFRERKEKHARDLETALSALTEKYRNLETSHSELSAAYEKLRKTIELLTKDDDDGGEDIKGQSKETLRKLLEIIHGEVGARAAAIAKQ